MLNDKWTKFLMICEAVHVFILFSQDNANYQSLSRKSIQFYFQIEGAMNEQLDQEREWTLPVMDSKDPFEERLNETSGAWKAFAIGIVAKRIIEQRESLEAFV